MASRLRLVGRTPGGVGDSDPNPGVSSKAEAGEREGETNRVEQQPPPRWEVTDLGGGSEVVHVPRFLAREKAWEWFNYLDKTIPWTRPIIRVFGRSSPSVRTVAITHFFSSAAFYVITGFDILDVFLLSKLLAMLLFWQIARNSCDSSIDEEIIGFASLPLVGEVNFALM